MVIPEIPDNHLQRLHWYLGPGKGSEYGYKHLPSGIMVGGAKPPGLTVFEFDRQLIAQLAAKLKEVGLLTGTDVNGQCAHE
jgi:hypothetical protein